MSFFFDNDTDTYEKRKVFNYFRFGFVSKSRCLKDILYRFESNLSYSKPS